MSTPALHLTPAESLSHLRERPRLAESHPRPPHPKQGLWRAELPGSPPTHLQPSSALPRASTSPLWPPSEVQRDSPAPLRLLPALLR